MLENSTGKKRLVVNLRHLNRFLWKQKFKYEDLRVAMMLLEKGDFLFSFDLKSGYHHIDKERDSLRFFGAGADSTATGSGATRAGELAPSGGPVRPASQPSGGNSNCGGAK